MEFVEVILLSLAILAVFSLGKSVTNAAKGTQPLTEPRTPAEPASQAKASLNIEGTQPVTSGVGFVHSYGFKPSEVRDIRKMEGISKLAEATEHARNCLDALWKEGHVRGPEIAAFVQGGEDLPQGQAVYFVLLGGPRDVFAFVTASR